MTFTGQLGTSASMPGNIALGFAPVMGGGTGGTPPKGSGHGPQPKGTAHNPRPTASASTSQPKGT